MGHGDEDRVYLTEDLASGDNLVFAATGVTAGDLLQGVRFFGGGARTHSLVDGLPDQAGPLRRHGPHVRPGPAARRSGSERACAVRARRQRDWIVAIGGGRSAATRWATGRPLVAFLLAMPRALPAATGRGSAPPGRRRPTPRDPGRLLPVRRRRRGETSRARSSGRVADLDGRSCWPRTSSSSRGNTVNMLAIWRQHGVDRRTRPWEAGVRDERRVGRRGSAGSGLLDRLVRAGAAGACATGSACCRARRPALHGEGARRRSFHGLVADGTVPRGGLRRSTTGAAPSSSAGRTWSSVLRPCPRWPERRAYRGRVENGERSRRDLPASRGWTAEAALRGFQPRRSHVAIGRTARGLRPARAGARRPGDGLDPAGWHEAGRQVGERSEDEQPLPGEPMRDDEVGRLGRVVGCGLPAAARRRSGGGRRRAGRGRARADPSAPAPAGRTRARCP